MADKKIELGGISVEDVEVEGRNIILVSGKGLMTLTSAKKGSLELTFGTGKNKSTYYFKNHAVYNSDKTAVSLVGSADDFKATGKFNSALVTINASQVDTWIELTGNSKGNVIIAGDRGSTLNGAKGNDTLIGGDGYDTFVYSKNQGNDLIRNYDEDYDEISLVGGAAVTNAAVNKNNSVVFTVGKNKLTVEGAASQEVKFSDTKGTTIFKDGVFYSYDRQSVTVSASFSEKGETYFDDTVVTINASAAKKGVNLEGTSRDNSIVGSAKNDSISGYYGADIIDGGKGNDKLWGESDNDTLIGSEGNDSLNGGKGNDKLWSGYGNDTLWGGAGNDTLWGDYGNDTFIYKPGEGNDVIYDFENGDKLTIENFTFDSTKATVSKNGTEVKLKIGAGSITFKDFYATTFNINNENYQISEVTDTNGRTTGYKFNKTS